MLEIQDLNSTIELLQTRASCAKLTGPAPNADELAQILRCGLRGPDHGRLKPWRFSVVQGAARHKLGEVFAQAAEAAGDCAQAKVDKCRNMPLRAPLMLVAVCEPQLNSKIPLIDQVLAVGAAVQNMQIAISALGYASIWRTGDMVQAKEVRAAFDVSAAGSIVAFLYIGTPQIPARVAPVELEPFVKDWI